MRFGLVVGSNGLLKLTTTNNDSAFANSDTLQFTTAHTMSSPPALSSPVVARYRLPITSSVSVLTPFPVGYSLTAGQMATQLIQVQVQVILRLTVSQCVLVSSPGWGPWPDFFYESYCPVHLGRLL
jgi:hypothetical protein